jgi:hypothetical protein
LSSLVSSSHKAALIYDGVHLFSRAVENLISETDLTTPQVGCDNKDSPYDLGDRLLQEINSVSAYLMITPCDTLDEAEPFLMMSTSDSHTEIKLDTPKRLKQYVLLLLMIQGHEMTVFLLSILGRSKED